MNYLSLNARAAILAAAPLALMVALPVQSADVDHRIEASAKQSYNFKTYLKDDNIKVESSGGVVALTGTVARDYHKYLAQETVSGLPGVKSVNNQLVVVGDQPTDHSDGWISMKVKAALAFRSNVSASETEVDTQKGVVTLKGKAETEAQKQLTTEYAKDVEGVIEVRNETVVSNPPRPHHRSAGEKIDDSSITAQVKTTLLFHKSTHALATRVSTRDGAVTLHGEARNGAEKELVTKLTHDIRGVKSVHNKMSVQKS